MPKVSEEYFENKRNAILDAAQRVCNKKPVYEVTMRDIIRECGLSQGGIYRFFENLDDVFAGLLNRYYDASDFEEQTKRIFYANIPPAQVIQKLCRYLTIYKMQTIRDYGKMIFELQALLQQSPARYRALRDKLLEQAAYERLKGHFCDFCNLQIDLCNFHPVMEREKIYCFLFAAFDGIDRSAAIHYSCEIPLSENEEALTEVVGAMEGLERAALLLLGA